MSKHHEPRGGQKPKSLKKPTMRLAALFLCLSMLAGLFPVLARAEDAGPLFSSIVDFDSVTLHRSTDGTAVGAEVSNGEMLNSEEPLVLLYKYTITEEQCSQIKPDIQYYLQVSPHLVLPHLETGSPLSVEVETKSGTQREQFGTIYANGISAWVTFLPDGENAENTLLNEKYGELDSARFYLSCHRAGDVPNSETPIEGHDNRYAMKFENYGKLQFGYAEYEPKRAEARLQKDGSLTGKTITWEITYTPWQNPNEADEQKGVTQDTPFELLDTIDASFHDYVKDSVTIAIGDSPVADIAYYTSRDDLQGNEAVYVIVETPAEGGNTTLTFGGQNSRQERQRTKILQNR